MILNILTTAEETATQLAQHIIERITAFSPTMHRKFVLGMAASSALGPVYQALEGACRAQLISFEFVVVIVLDEYFGIGAESLDSKASLMERELFSRIDLPPGQIVMLSASMPDSTQECSLLEAKILSLGGIHLLVADLGEHGQLGMNAQGGSLGGRTRVVEIPSARQIPEVTRAMTMGLGTMFEADEIVVLATGTQLAVVVQEVLEGGITHMTPASVLQLHQDVMFYADTAASSLLGSDTRSLLAPPESITQGTALSSPLSLPSPSSLTTSPDSPMHAHIRMEPVSAIPSPNLNPFMEHPSPLDAVLATLKYGVRNRCAASGAGGKQGLRVIPAFPLVEGMRRNRAVGLADWYDHLVNVQEGDEDDAGPGW